MQPDCQQRAGTTCGYAQGVDGIDDIEIVGHVQPGKVAPYGEMVK
jgi:hypothetical protein